MSKTKEIRNLLAELEAVRKDCADKIAALSNNEDFSDAYKTRESNRIIEETKTKLADIQTRTEAALPDWDAIAAKQTRFNYSDPKLLSAVQFIEANGAGLPETAWRTMIADFANRPAELFYLSDMFDKNKVVSAAIQAKEAAQKISFSETLPQRVSDAIYYVTTAEPTAHVDTSGLLNDLDAMDAFETQTADDAESE